MSKKSANFIWSIIGLYHILLIKKSANFIFHLTYVIVYIIII
nr:MAG TPA: hypothetical protein [Caudoviricetes sp.]